MSLIETGLPRPPERRKPAGPRVRPKYSSTLRAYLLRALRHCEYMVRDETSIERVFALFRRDHPVAPRHPIVACHDERHATVFLMLDRVGLVWVLSAEGYEPASNQGQVRLVPIEEPTEDEEYVLTHTKGFARSRAST